MPRMEVAQNATVGFRLPAEMRTYLQRRAQEEHTTVSRYLVMLILMDMLDGDRKAGTQFEKQGI